MPARLMPPPLCLASLPQPEAVRSAIDAVLAQPLDTLGDALQGFTWDFESKASGREGVQQTAWHGMAGMAWHGMALLVGCGDAGRLAVAWQGMNASQDGL